MKECRQAFLRDLSSWVLKGQGTADLRDFFIEGPDAELYSAKDVFKNSRLDKQNDLRRACITLNMEQVPFFMDVSEAEGVVTMVQNVLLMKSFSVLRKWGKTVKIL